METRQWRPIIRRCREQKALGVKENVSEHYTLGSLAYFADQAIRYTPVLLAMLFLISSSIDILIFMSWGLDFLHIATPIDIFMTMLRLGVPAIVMLAVSLTVSFIITRIVPGRIQLISSIFLIFMPIIMVATYLIYIFYYQAERKHTGAVFDYVFIVTALTLGVAALRLQTLSFGGRYRRINDAIDIGTAVGASIALFFLFNSGAGFLPRVRLVAKIDNCPGAQIRWRGEDALVFDCDNKSKAVVFGPENFVTNNNPKK